VISGTKGRQQSNDNNMNRVLELIGSFPTVVFTAVLAFCLVWWIISLVLSGGEGGNDGDADFDVDADADVDVDVDTDVELSHGHAAGHVQTTGHVGRIGQRSHTSGRHGAGKGGRGVGWRLAKAIRFGQIPLSLSLTIISFGGFAISGLLQLAAEGDTRHLGAAVGIPIMALALAVGLVLHRWFAQATRPLFVTTTAPERHAAIGATCRIRTTHVTASLGEAEVTSGSAIGQIVRVRTDSGDFVRGDIAHLVGYDQKTGAFTIVELDPELKELL
jgi:Protein of unknown function (DUF1449)